MGSAGGALAVLAFGLFADGAEQATVTRRIGAERRGGNRCRIGEACEL